MARVLAALITALGLGGGSIPVEGEPVALAVGRGSVWVSGSLTRVPF